LRRGDHGGKGEESRARGCGWIECRIGGEIEEEKYAGESELGISLASGLVGFINALVRFGWEA
jgi:hypothetical protein